MLLAWSRLCQRKRTPKTNSKYWIEKIRKNIQRDIKNQAELTSLGWNVLVVWECETKDLDELVRKISKYLSNQRA